MPPADYLIRSVWRQAKQPVGVAVVDRGARLGLEVERFQHFDRGADVAEPFSRLARHPGAIRYYEEKGIDET